MITLRTDAAVDSTIALLADNELRTLLIERTKELAEWLDQGIDLSDLTHFLIMQPGDTAADAENELGWSLLTNAIEETALGDPDFTPSWEWIEHHDGWYEAVYIISDDGFGVGLFIADHPGTDPDLLTLCRSA